MHRLLAENETFSLYTFLIHSLLPPRVFCLFPSPSTSYEEREACIERIAKNHKEPTTYEDFASLVFCPVPKPAGSEPPTPVLSAERRQMLRAQTVPTASLSDSEKTSIRHRSKSAVTSPRMLSNKLGEHLCNRSIYFLFVVRVILSYILEFGDTSRFPPPLHMPPPPPHSLPPPTQNPLRRCISPVGQPCHMKIDFSKPGFHMIATIARVVSILSQRSQEWLPYDRNDRSDRCDCDRCDHMETMETRL